MVSYYLILYLSIFGGGILNFSDRLRYLRMSRGFSRKEVYEAIGSSKPSYYRYENGDSEPSTQKLIALAKYFNVSIDYLVGRTDNPAIDNENTAVPNLTPQKQRLQEKILSLDNQNSAELESFLNYLLQKNSSQDKAAESK